MSKSKVIRLNPNKRIAHDPRLDKDIMCIKTSDGRFTFNPMHFKLSVREHGWIDIEPRRRKA